MSLFKKRAKQLVSLPYQLTAPGVAHPRFNPFAAHAYQEMPFPVTPGAAGWVYALWGSVEYSPVGTGIACRQYLRLEQAPVTVAIQAVRRDGVGGLSAGQLLSTPLQILGYRPAQGISE